jgi:4-hydroxy-3-methylbut-2-en-1-yl diphosphate reductase
MVLVETAADVDALTLPADTKLAFLTQTTLSVDEARIVIDAIRKKYPQVVGPNKDDICYATQNRQEAVREIVPEVDVVLVLGSQNSSNSQRLAEIARTTGKAAHLIDRASELQDSWFDPTDTVLVTAGASAPEDHVQDCVAYLQKTFGATVETRTVREEDVHFRLPMELRTLAN